MKKKPIDQETEATDTEQTTHAAAKKKFKSADLVFAGGVVAIVAGMFWMIGGSSNDKKQNMATEENITTSQAATDTNIKKTEDIPPALTTQAADDPSPIPGKENTQETAVETKPPFVYSNEADFSTDTLIPPPEEYEQNVTKLSKKQTPPVEKKSSVAKEVQIPKQQTKAKSVPSPEVTIDTSSKQAEASKEKASRSVSRQPIKPLLSDADSGSTYVCSILDGFEGMLGKEIMYYLRDDATHKYLPAFSQPNWNESGVWIKKRLIASKVDTKERMVEVSPNKWIPALEFMSCTVVQEEGR